jgi:hypothetical protein
MLIIDDVVQRLRQAADAEFVCHVGTSCGMEVQGWWKLEQLQIQEKPGANNDYVIIQRERETSECSRA